MDNLLLSGYRFAPTHSLQYSQPELNRQALAQLCSLYYRGEPYQHPELWRKVLNYQPDLPVPQLYVNLPRMLVERITQAGFANITNIVAQSAELNSPAVNKLVNLVLPHINEWVTQALVAGDLLLIASKHGEDCTIRALPADCFAIIPDPQHPDQSGFAIELLQLNQPEPQLIVEHHFENRIVYFAPIPYRAALNPERKLAVQEIKERSPREPMPTQLRNRPSLESNYGRSEFADLLRLVDDFNFKLSQRSRNISRTMNALIKSINGRIINTEIGDSEVVHIVGDNAQFDYLINEADMQPIEDHLNALKWAIRETTGVTVFGLDDLKAIGQLSGFALRQLNRPMQALVNSKRATLGKDIERFFASIVPLVETNPQLTNSNWQLVYANDFEFSEQELSLQTDRIINLLDRGIITTQEARNWLQLPN